MANNADERSQGGLVVPITNTTQTTGPFYRLVASSNGCTVTTTGLSNNLSSFTVAAGCEINFGIQTAATITLAAGECLAYKAV